MHLYIYVEGSSDERFFRKVLPPLPPEHRAKIITYVGKKRKDRKKIISQIRAIEDNPGGRGDYLFVRDADRRTDEETVSEIRKKWGRAISRSKIVVVRCMIESWYAAVMPEKMARGCKIGNIANTEDITKEDFRNWLHGETETDMMTRILAKYSAADARRRNASFRKFYDMYEDCRRGLGGGGPAGPRAAPRP